MWIFIIMNDSFGIPWDSPDLLYPSAEKLGCPDEAPKERRSYATLDGLQVQGVME
jgi:hypothetical protein